jgi:preprotein translocase subunit YajC
LFGLLHSFSTWFQPDATGAAPSGGSPAAGGGGGVGPGITQFGLMVLMMVVFYLVLIRPQQRKQRELDKLLKSLKKGQRVRTSGGIRGEIVDFKSDAGDEVVLLVSDRVKINILRSHISGVLDAGEAQEAKS